MNQLVYLVMSTSHIEMSRIYPEHSVVNHVQPVDCMVFCSKVSYQFSPETSLILQFHLLCLSSKFLNLYSYFLWPKLPPMVISFKCYPAYSLWFCFDSQHKTCRNKETCSCSSNIYPRLAHFFFDKKQWSRFLSVTVCGLMASKTENTWLSQNCRTLNTITNGGDRHTDVQVSARIDFLLRWRPGSWFEHYHEHLERVDSGQVVSQSARRGPAPVRTPGQGLPAPAWRAATLGGVPLQRCDGRVEGFFARHTGTYTRRTREEKQMGCGWKSLPRLEGNFLGRARL